MNDPNFPNPFLVIGIFVVTLAFVRVFTTFVHEMGHALAGLILLKGNVDVYIGSYGDPDKGYHFKIGRIKFHFIYDPLSVEKGVFRSEQQDLTYFKDFLITLAGPLASLITAGIYIYLAAFTSLPDMVKIAFYILTGSSFLDFWYNMKPDTTGIILYDENIVYNDGYMLKYRWNQMFNKDPESSDVI